MYLKTAYYLLTLNIRTLFRISVEIGLIRTIILCFIALVFSIRFLPSLLLDANYSFLISLICLIPISFSRNENVLIRDLGLSIIKVKLLRNLILILPSIVYFFAMGYNQSIVISIAIALALSPEIKFKKINSISVFGLEWKTQILNWNVFLARNALIILLIYAFSFGSFISPAFPLISIFLLHFVALGFLYHNEPIDILESYSFNNEILLNHISKYSILYQIILLLVPSLNLIIWNPNLWWLSILIILMLSVHHLLSIYLKYSFYEIGPGNNAGESIQVIMFVFLFIPFTFFIPFINLFRYRKKAIINMNKYLR